MATVYLATDQRLERRVAIKVMHGHLADDNTFKARFVQEARSTARLAHPNVVNVFDQGQDEHMAYLVMEYLPGMTLRDLLRERKRLSPEQAYEIMHAVLSGLAAAHRAGIVHRDVKPENVLLADDGRIKLGDFGLARAASANTATGQALLGTIAYLSPELVTRGVADARSDIYAAGIMLYEMLTGEQPYVGEAPMQIAYQHANDSVPKPSAKRPNVPKFFDELVAWATARNPDDRPADARELLERLRQFNTDLSGATEAITPIENSTMVLPDGSNSTEVLRPVAAPAPSPLPTPPRLPAAPADAVATLTKQAHRRKQRGAWLMVLVLLLAGLAGGAGWWFGAGPGGMVAVAETANESPDVAQAKLIDQGFKVQTREANDVSVANGLVIGTEPGAGTAVRRGSTVTMVVSLGPRILPVPDVRGKSEAEARSLLPEFVVAAAGINQFDAKAPKGNVIAVLGPDGKAVPAELAEKSAVTLVVSAGPIPDVTGKTQSDAEGALHAVELNVAYGEPEFSNDVEKDHVIKQLTAEGPVKPGDTVKLVLSKGPELFEIPRFKKGTTIREAVQALEALGFKVDAGISDSPIIFSNKTAWDVYKVANTDPEAGTMAPKGSLVKIQPTF